jgi:hypothetical protein
MKKILRWSNLEDENLACYPGVGAGGLFLWDFLGLA